MDYTMAHQNSIRNYSHCPPKKRPFAYYDAQSEIDNDDQPQDLRVKRRRNDDDQNVPSRSTPPPTASPSASQLPDSPSVPHPVSSPRIPSLADFYMKLFQEQQHQQQQEWWRGPPVMWPLIPTPTHHPSLASHPALATQSVLAAHPVLAARLASPQPSEERLASPRSTVSEDSGVGTETLSEDEIDVITEPEALRGSGFDITHENNSTLGVIRNETRYSCTGCCKSYSTYSGLSKHKQFHCAALGAKSFACKHCEKVYTSLGALKMHIRTHTLPCKCHLCGKAFSRPWLLQGHIRTHTGEKPFQCPQCDRCFADRSNLRAHLQTHAHVKKYACATCHKTFSRMSLLNKHTEAACPARPQQQQQIVPVAIS